MEVVNSSTALLSNYEFTDAHLPQVFQLLSGLRGKGEQSRNISSPLATITYEVVKFLESAPASAQNETVIQTFMKEIDRFNLTKAEKLMILNLRPTTAVEIALIVQTTEQERLTDEQVEEMIQVIQDTLPEPKSK